MSIINSLELTNYSYSILRTVYFAFGYEIDVDPTIKIQINTNTVQTLYDKYCTNTVKTVVLCWLGIKVKYLVLNSNTRELCYLCSVIIRHVASCDSHMSNSTYIFYEIYHLGENMSPEKRQLGRKRLK